MMREKDGNDECKEGYKTWLQEYLRIGLKIEEFFAEARKTSKSGHITQLRDRCNWDDSKIPDSRAAIEYSAPCSPSSRGDSYILALRQRKRNQGEH